MEVRRIGETFFAEVDDVDVSKGFDAAEWQAFYGAYLEHQVLVLHGQTLSAAQFHALGERFGLVEPHTVSMYHHDEFKGITVLSNRTEMGRPKGIRDAGSSWHSDYSYKPVPANATMLYALEIPDAGGDTIFADLAAAYSALSDEKKASLEGLRVRQAVPLVAGQNPCGGPLEPVERNRAGKDLEVVHPLVRIRRPVAKVCSFQTPSVPVSKTSSISTGREPIADRRAVRPYGRSPLSGAS